MTSDHQRPTLSRATWALTAALSLVAACSAPQPSGTPVPASEGTELASTLERTTQLEGASSYMFDWRLEERGTRMASGRGVARAQQPYQARLDLFAGSGETVAKATLLDDDLHLPAGVPDEIAAIIPPSNLLWAALGVFRPGAGSTLQGARRNGASLDLRYLLADGQEVRYVIEGDRVRQVQLLERGRALHEISLTPAEGQRYPREATYRNLAEFRELTLVTRSVEHVDAYPPDIFRPLP